MTTGIGGTRFEDGGSVDLNAAKFNQLNPHGHIYQASGDSDLQVSVMPANWFERDQTLNEYAGSTANAISTSVTVWLYLDSSNALQISTTLPDFADDFFVLGRVTTNGSAVTTIEHINRASSSLKAYIPHGYVYQASGDTALQVTIAPANWLESDASENAYAGATAQATTDDATRYVYIDDSNALQFGSSLPALSNDYFLCAKVVAASGVITSITNYNAPLASFRT